MCGMQPAEYFADSPAAFAIHRKVEAAVSDNGKAEIRVSQSDIGFYRKRAFAATWRPDKYLTGDHASLILSVYLVRRDTSSRWKEIVEPAPDRFTHHVELRSSDDVDDFIRTRLDEAWRSAG